MTASFWNTHVRDNENALIQGTSTITTTGAQAGLALPGGHGDLVIFANNASLLTINGITPGYDGQRLRIFSIGAGQVSLAHQSGSATGATYRLINMATSANMLLAAGSGQTSLIYDTTAGRWRMESFDQGAWITPTFAAGDFTGGGSQTWTLAAGDVGDLRYRLSARALEVAWRLSTTSVGGTPNAALRIGNGQFGGFTIGAATCFGDVQATDNGGSFFQSICIAGSAYDSARINIYRNPDGTTTWAAATDATAVNGSIRFEVT